MKGSSFPPSLESLRPVPLDRCGRDDLPRAVPPRRFPVEILNADGSSRRCAETAAAVRRGTRSSAESPAGRCVRDLAGIIRAVVSGRRVKLQMTEPSGLARPTLTLHGGRSGIPSSTRACRTSCSSSPGSKGRPPRGRPRNPKAPRVLAERYQRELRTGSKRCGPIRTYERGVEGETLACGTGAVACGILSAAHGSSVPRCRPHPGRRCALIHFDGAGRVRRGVPGR